MDGATRVEPAQQNRKGLVNLLVRVLRPHDGHRLAKVNRIIVLMRGVELEALLAQLEELAVVHTLRFVLEDKAARDEPVHDLGERALGLAKCERHVGERDTGVIGDVLDDVGLPGGVCLAGAVVMGLLRSGIERRHLMEDVTCRDVVNGVTNAVIGYWLRHMQPPFIRGNRTSLLLKHTTINRGMTIPFAADNLPFIV